MTPRYGMWLKMEEVMGTPPFDKQNSETTVVPHCCPNLATKKFGKCFLVGAAKTTSLYGMRFGIEVKMGGTHFPKQNSRTSAVPHSCPISATKKVGICYFCWRSRDDFALWAVIRKGGYDGGNSFR